MMMYRVVNNFIDLQDRYTAYQKGENYPKTGVIPSETRIDELLTNNNRLKMPLIEEVTERKPKTISKKQKTKEE